MSFADSPNGSSGRRGWNGLAFGTNLVHRLIQQAQTQIGRGPNPHPALNTPPQSPDGAPTDTNQPGRQDRRGRDDSQGAVSPTTIVEGGSPTRSDTDVDDSRPAGSTGTDDQAPRLAPPLIPIPSRKPVGDDDSGPASAGTTVRNRRATQGLPKRLPLPVNVDFSSLMRASYPASQTGRESGLATVVEDWQPSERDDPTDGQSAMADEYATGPTPTAGRNSLISYTAESLFDGSQTGPPLSPSFRMFGSQSGPRPSKEGQSKHKSDPILNPDGLRFQRTNRFSVATGSSAYSDPAYDARPTTLSRKGSRPLSNSHLLHLDTPGMSLSTTTLVPSLRRISTGNIFPQLGRDELRDDPADYMKGAHLKTDGGGDMVNPLAAHPVGMSVDGRHLSPHDTDETNMFDRSDAAKQAADSTIGPQSLGRPSDSTPVGPASTGESAFGSVGIDGSPPINRHRRNLILTLVAVSHFLTQLGLGQVISAAGIIGREFGSNSVIQLAWFMAAYTLAIGATIPVAARFGTVFGHFDMLVAGWLWLGIWSAFTGFSAYTHSQAFFCLCRAMQGVGSAFLLPNGLGLLSRMYEQERWPLVLQVFGAVAPVGILSGCMTGTAWAGRVWWPWAFWSYGLACFGLALFLIVIVPRHLKGRHRILLDRFDIEKSVFPPLDSMRPTIPGQEPSEMARIRNLFSRIDIVGSTTLIAGLVLFAMSWNNGSVFGWDVQHVFLLLIMGLVFLSWFVYSQAKSRHPLLPAQSLNISVTWILAVLALCWAAFGTWLFFLLRFLQVARRENPLTSALHFIPFVPSGIVSTFVTVRILSPRISFEAMLMIGTTMFFIGSVLAGTMPIRQIYWSQSFVSILFMPWGLIMTLYSTGNLLPRVMPVRVRHLALPFVYATIFYSISMGLGVSGTVFSSRYNNLRRSRVDEQTSIRHAFRGAFLTAVVMTSVALLLVIGYNVRDLKQRRRERAARDAVPKPNPTSTAVTS